MGGVSRVPQDPANAQLECFWIVSDGFKERENCTGLSCGNTRKQESNTHILQRTESTNLPRLSFYPELKGSRIPLSPQKQ